MADITIEAVADNILYAKALRSGIFWTSPTVGYAIYLDFFGDLVYRKTSDGGATWSASPIVIVAAEACNAAYYDCWADWQTAGDAGTKIHIAYMSIDLNQIRYVYLDTSTDTVGGDDLIETCRGTGTFYTTVLSLQYQMVSITKTRGGNLAVALKYKDSALAAFNSFYTSPDGDTWTSRTSPYEVADDYCLLFPGNEADNQDVWGTYWDVSANEISLKTYDDSGNSWSEQSISLNMTESTSYLQMDGAVRLSDGHLVFAAWNLCDNAAADLMVWDINGAGSITAKTNVITDEAETVLVSVFVNQVNDDIYITYVSGTMWTSLVKVFYQKSVDGGANWGGETAMQVDEEDDERWISAGAMKASWGGKFQPIWFNDDLNDLFNNVDNGISIAAVVPASYKDVATRFKLWARNFKDIATRFKLWVQEHKDVPTRFKIIALDYQDTVTRFKLVVQAYQDTSTRFKLRGLSYKDISARFKLRVRGYQDVSTRFRLWVQSYQDIAARFRLRAQNYQDVSTRFKLWVQGYRDVTTRFVLTVSAYKDVATRFRLLVQSYTDVATRFRLVAQTYQDTATRFWLIRYYFRDVSTRFMLAPSSGYRDVGARFFLYVPTWKELQIQKEIAELEAEIAKIKRPKAHFRI